MDLNSLEVKKETATIALFHPTENTPLTNDDGTPMSVTVYGKYSRKYREIQQSQQNARLKRAERGGKMKLSASEIVADRLDLIVGCVESWNIQLDGEYPDCLLYTSPSPRDGLLSRMPSSA